MAVEIHSDVVVERYFLAVEVVYSKVEMVTHNTNVDQYRQDLELVVIDFLIGGAVVVIVIDLVIQARWQQQRKHMWQII